jgi:hypothetical protein
METSDSKPEISVAILKINVAKSKRFDSERATVAASAARRETIAFSRRTGAIERDARSTPPLDRWSGCPEDHKASAKAPSRSLLNRRSLEILNRASVA